MSALHCDVLDMKDDGQVLVARAQGVMNLLGSSTQTMDPNEIDWEVYCLAIDKICDLIPDLEAFKDRMEEYKKANMP